MNQETTKPKTMEEQAVEPRKQVVLFPEHNVAAFAGQDEVRFAINSVHYNAEKGRIEATDGKMLIMVPVKHTAEFPPVHQASSESPAKSCVIPLQAFRNAMRNVPKKAKLPVLSGVLLETQGEPDDVTRQPDNLSLTTTDLDMVEVVTQKPVAAKFPTLDQLVPTDPAKLTINISAEILATIGRYFMEHGKIQNRVGLPVAVTLEFTDELSPIRFSGKIERSGEIAKGVFMPMKF